MLKLNRLQKMRDCKDNCKALLLVTLQQRGQSMVITGSMGWWLYELNTLCVCNSFMIFIACNFKGKKPQGKKIKHVARMGLWRAMGLGPSNDKFWLYWT